MVTHGRSAGRNFYRTRMYMDQKLNLMRMVQFLIRTAGHGDSHMVFYDEFPGE